jgi:hypothetical protein
METIYCAEMMTLDDSTLLSPCNALRGFDRVAIIDNAAECDGTA